MTRSKQTLLVLSVATITGWGCGEFPGSCPDVMNDHELHLAIVDPGKKLGEDFVVTLHFHEQSPLSVSCPNGSHSLESGYFSCRQKEPTGYAISAQIFLGNEIPRIIRVVIEDEDETTYFDQAVQQNETTEKPRCNNPYRSALIEVKIE